MDIMIATPMKIMRGMGIFKTVPLPKKRNSSGNPCNPCPLVIIIAIPIKRLFVPRVAMIAGTLAKVITRPLMSPQTIDVAIAAIIASKMTTPAEMPADAA